MDMQENKTASIPNIVTKEHMIPFQQSLKPSSTQSSIPVIADRPSACQHAFQHTVIADRPRKRCFVPRVILTVFYSQERDGAFYPST